MPARYENGIARPWLVWTALWIVYIVWGSTYMAIRVTVETLPPLFSGGVRFLIAGAIVYLVLLARRGRGGVSVTGPEVVASTLVGAALLLGGNGLVSVAEQDVPSALAALIIASVPLWVIVLRTITGDLVPRSTLIGVGVGFVGVAILMLPGERPDGATLSGMLLLVVASVSWASGSFFSKRLPLPKDALVSTAIQQIMGGLVLCAAGLGIGELDGFALADVSTASLMALGYLVVFGSLLAFTAYTWLLQNAPISKVATYAYVNPVIAIILGWALLNEQITATILAGAAVIVASVASIVRRESELARRGRRVDIPSEAAEPSVA